VALRAGSELRVLEVDSVPTTDAMMTDTAARMLIKQQQHQQIIGRALENFKKIGRQNLTPAKIRSRVQTLKETWTQFLNGHSELLKLVEDGQEAIAYFKERQFDITEETFQSTLDYMAECLEELVPPAKSKPMIRRLGRAGRSVVILSDTSPSH